MERQMLKIAPDRVGEEAVPCRFKLVNGDSYPKLPPESLLSSEDDCQILIRPADRFEPRDPPLYFDVDPGVAGVTQEHRIRFETFAQTRLAESSIMVLPEGSVVTDGFFTADRSRNILVDSFRAYGMVSKYGFDDLGDRRLERPLVTGDTVKSLAVAVGIQTNTNYFHWLLEALPRLWLARRFDGLEAATILVPPMRPWMAEMVAAVGADPRRLLVPKAEETRCGRLVVPARGLGNIHTFAWHAFQMVDDLAARLTVRRRSRRLFISRKDAASRRITNEDEIFALAARYGFERVFPEKLSFSDQMALFAETEAVAGALGAGLTNSVFMPAGGALIEFAPEQRQGDAVLFANLAHHRKLHYAGIVGTLDENSMRTFDRRDFSISPDMADKAFSTLE